MIITRTPYRVSLFGGGTDYPVWFREHGGAVLVASIDRYCYISCRYLPPFFEHRSRVVYSKTELVHSNGDIEHPAVRAVLAALHVEDGIEIHHDGDLPARTGVGSSSSFTVGLLHAVHALLGAVPSRMELAGQAIHLEQDVLGEAVGCQDQVIAAHGGLVRVDFATDGAFRVTPLRLSGERRTLLQQHLLMFFTGFSRTASEIAAEQIRRTPELGRELRALGALVNDAEDVLCNGGDLTDVGRLLHESWRIKRSLTTRVSTPTIDDIYRSARAAGATGGKLMGAGGGGFMLLFAPPERHADIRSALAELLEVPFSLESGGTQLLLDAPGPRARRLAPIT